METRCGEIEENKKEEKRRRLLTPTTCSLLTFRERVSRPWMCSLH